VLTRGRMGQINAQQWLGIYGFIGVYDNIDKLLYDYKKTVKEIDIEH